MIKAVHARFGAEVIETEAEAAIAAHAVLDAAAREAAHTSSIIVAAFADPGVTALRQLLPNLPCIGLGEAAWRAVASCNVPFGIVTGGAATIPATRRSAEAAGLAERLVGIHLISGPLSSVIQNPHGAAADASRGINKLAQNGAKAILLAGAPLVNIIPVLSQSASIRIVDALEEAVRRAVVVTNKRAGPMSRPPSSGQKQFRGLPSSLTQLLRSQPLPVR
jgi:Asp/Glu/hydantoin racemase